MAKGWGSIRSTSGPTVPGATVKVYLAGTSTLASIFSDAALSVAIDQTNNPVMTDADGTYEFYVATGTYKIVGTKDTLTFTEDNVDIGYSVPAARTISTTSPLTGGGDLSDNRTLAFDFSTDESVTGQWTLADPLLKGPVHDVRAYGATGDGVADDTVEIQAALDAVGAAGGGSVLIPLGQFNISATLTVPSNVLVQGVGYGSRVHMTVADTQMFLCQATHNVGFSSLRLTGQGGFTTPGSGAIRLGLGSVGNGCDDSWVFGCWLEGVSNCGITIGSESNRCRIVNTYIDQAGEEGIYLLGSNCAVIGCVSDNNGEAGIKVRGSQVLVTDNLFRGNTQFGILVTTASFAVVVSGNVCSDNGTDGIRLADSATDALIAGNVCTGNSQAADDTHSNISINGASVARVCLIGNVCRDGGGAAQPKYGIGIVNGTGTIVGDNDLYDGGRTAQYNDAGTNTQGIHLKARQQAATSATTINASTDADITGCSISVTPLQSQTVVVYATANVTRVVADTLILTLDVNGADQSGQLVIADAGRQTVSGAWVLTLVGGTAYTIKLEGKVQTGTGGDFTVHETHTKLVLTPAGGPA